MTIRRSLIVALLAAAIAVGCQFVADLKHPTDAGTDAEPNEASLPDAPITNNELPLACAPKPPGPPTQSADPGNLTFGLVFSYFTSFTRPPADAGEELCPIGGFHLDEQTCVPGPPSDAAPNGECRTNCRPTSLDAGVDNVGGELVSGLASHFVALGAPETPTTSFEHGGANVMLRISDYNGGPDDDDVGVDFLSLSGLSQDTFPLPDAALPDGAVLDAAAWQQAWDRRSLRDWDIDPNSFVDGGLSLPKSRGTAYVANNVLVVHLGTVPVSFSGASLQLEHTTYSGELRKTARGWTLVRGRMGGEILFETMKLAVRQFAGRNSTLCDGLVGVVAASDFCRSADRGYDGGCDAISLGASFTMVEGRAGLLRSPPDASICAYEICK